MDVGKMWVSSCVITMAPPSPYYGPRYDQLDKVVGIKPPENKTFFHIPPTRSNQGNRSGYLGANIRTYRATSTPTGRRIRKPVEERMACVVARLTGNVSESDIVVCGGRLMGIEQLVKSKPPRDPAAC